MLAFYEGLHALVPVRVVKMYRDHDHTGIETYRFDLLVTAERGPYHAGECLHEMPGLHVLPSSHVRTRRGSFDRTKYVIGHNWGEIATKAGFPITERSII